MKKQLHPVKRFVADVKVLNNQPHRHWHYVYRHRRAKKIMLDEVSTWQIIFAQLFVVAGSVFAGLILDVQKEDIGLIIGAFVLMPGIIDLSATIPGAMSAKINHQLDETPAHPISIAIHSVGFSLVIGIFAGTIVGLFGGVMSYLLFNGDIWQLTMLGMLSMFTISIVGYPFVAAMTLFIKKIGFNPDNIVGPVQSSLIDMLAIMVIASYARLLI